ncbi:hypothetical protein [Streptomyces avidinii]
MSSLVHRLLQDGTPSAQQRRALAEGGMPALRKLLLAGAPAD